ncbi:hypothetical protein [Kineococcus glutinatus]|uniref:Uncharacterized protein n=1 Tax=Kineococcus glutinatus TaxID=1070872 RepID=A0ABP8VBM8_9ACTN
MDVVKAVLPSLGILILFLVVVRAMIHGDRRERAALARLEKESRESGGDAGGSAR